MKALLLFSALTLALSTQICAQPIIRHLQYRARTQTLEIQGKFDGATASVNLAGKQLSIIARSDTTLVINFDSTAAPWHGEVTVSDINGESNYRRLSQYWLYLLGNEEFEAGTPASTTRWIELWLALPIDATSFQSNESLSWVIEPLPISRTKSFVNERYSNSNASGSFEGYLLPTNKDSIPGWSFSIRAYRSSNQIFISRAQINFVGTESVDGEPAKSVNFSTWVDEITMYLDDSLNILKGIKNYNKFDDPRLYHVANWRMDSVLSPSKVLDLAVRRSPIAVEEGGIAVYPNPTKDALSISPLLEGYCIFDLFGREVKKVELSIGFVSVTELPRGNYLIITASGKRAAFSKW
jgi:hypothetical protein